jgi:hypothetical protein
MFELTCTGKISFLTCDYTATDLTRTDMYSETNMVSLTSNFVSVSHGERKDEQGTSSEPLVVVKEFKDWSRWSVSWSLFCVTQWKSNLLTAQ